MKHWIQRFLTLFMAMVLAAAALAEDAYKLIAHTSAPVTSVTREEAASLLLKKTTTYAKWGDAAQKVVPFDLPADSPTRAAFTKAVHKKPVNAIRSYWQQQIFSGRGTPPSELAGDAEMIAAVARTAGGIGYVSGAATLPAGVKQVKVTD